MRFCPVTLLVLTACTGEMTSSVPMVPVCSEPPRLSRLSSGQYRAIVGQLLADAGVPKGLEVPFAHQRRTDLFSTWSGQASIGEYEVDEVWRAAQLVAPAWVAQNTLRCDGPERSLSCLRQLFGPVLTLLWSRPPTDDELTAVGVTLTEAERGGAPDEAMAETLRGLLISPRFLFRSELGVNGQLQSSEVAAALSFTLWGQPPDAPLREAAASGLTDPAAIAVQTRRLLERPTALPMLRHFLRELLAYDTAPQVTKGVAEHHPAELVDDTEQVIEQLVADHARSGLLRALLTSDLVYARPSTQKSWGLATGSDAGVFLHDPTRAGVLSHPAWLAAMSHPESNHLVRRGRFVRERLLCGTVPMLPGGVVPQIPNTPGLTLRQRNEQHALDPACAGCHKLMDPLAMGFEAWDHLGRPQTVDNGGAVVTSGVLEGAGSADGPYATEAELMKRLADSEVVQACWVKQVFRFVKGRDATAADHCELERLGAVYASSGEDTLAVVEAMFTAPGFLQRKQVLP